MNTHELIEYTMLHALGLLEDDERAVNLISTQVGDG